MIGCSEADVYETGVASRVSLCEPYSLPLGLISLKMDLLEAGDGDILGTAFCTSCSFQVVIKGNAMECELQWSLGVMRLI